MSIFKKSSVTPIVRSVISQGLEQDYDIGIGNEMGKSQDEDYFTHKNTLSDDSSYLEDNSKIDYSASSPEMIKAFYKYKETYGNNKSAASFAAGWNAALNTQSSPMESFPSESNIPPDGFNTVV